MISINLVRSVPNKDIRRGVLDSFFGLIPANGKTYSLESINENADYYRKLSASKAKRGGKKGELRPQIASLPNEIHKDVIGCRI